MSAYNFKIEEQPNGEFHVLEYTEREKTIRVSFFRTEKIKTYEWKILSTNGNPLSVYSPPAATFDSVEDAELFIKRKRKPLQKFL